MKLMPILIIGIIVTSCGEKAGPEFKSVTSTRTLFVYGLDTIQYERMVLELKIDYQLLVEENDSTKRFRYIDLPDSLRQVSFKVRKRNKRLLWGPLLESMIVDSSEFIINGKRQKFYLYDYVKPVIDAPSRVYFNDYYGVLNIGNPGSEFIYVNNSNVETADSLLKAVDW